jgi:hypothetical protein
MDDDDIDLLGSVDYAEDRRKDQGKAGSLTRRRPTRRSATRDWARERYESRPSGISLGHDASPC